MKSANLGVSDGRLSRSCEGVPHILVVDDATANVRFLVRLLERHNYIVLSASNGSEALDSVRDYQPDLILLDIMMPGMDGYEVCERLKANPATHDIPVIFISALDEVLDKVRAFSVGGVDYVTKPVRAEEVLARVQTHLMIRRLQQELLDKNVQLEQEVAERRAAEATLKQQRDELQDLVQERDAKVRELELTRAKVVQTVKLAALGEMATGVAHELNQPLTAMLFEADYLRTLAQQAVEKGQETLVLEVDIVAQIGDDLAQDIARSRRITDYLRGFSRASSGEITVVNLNHPIEDSFILTAARLSQQGVHVQRHLDEDLPPILANSSKLEQVFLNLIHNAELALEEMARRFEIGVVQRPDYRKILEISTYTDHDGVVASVYDNGCGIPEADQQRLFDPFFTTRTDREGSGLGLPISQDIITEFGGQITFESTENEGTTFWVRFPIYE